MRLAALGIIITMLCSVDALAQAPVWERGRDGRYEIAVAGIGPGTTLGFFCSAHQVPNTAIISLNNLILSPILPDGKNFDLRFVIDGVKFDLPGIAKDGELLVSPADANMELRVQEVTEALRVGKQAQIAVPAKAWKSKLPLDGADQALDGLFEPCW